MNKYLENKKMKFIKNVILLLTTLLTLSVSAQNCPADINNSPGNSPQNITATVYDENGEELFDISCRRTGNSQQIDCSLEDFDLENAMYITIDISQGNNTTECVYDVFGNNIGVLPVEFGNLTVARQGGENLLSWNTFSEVDNDYFTIEYSFDGFNWNELTTIDGAGNSNSENTYSYVHRISGFNMIYYRLKQSDFDGTTVELKTVSLQNMNKENITIDVKANTVNIFSENDIFEVVVTDIQGRKISLETVADNVNHKELIVEGQKGIKIITVVDVDGNSKRVKFY